jgi:hypothetical protein
MQLGIPEEHTQSGHPFPAYRTLAAMPERAGVYLQGHILFQGLDSESALSVNLFFLFCSSMITLLDGSLQVNSKFPYPG